MSKLCKDCKYSRDEFSIFPEMRCINNNALSSPSGMAEGWEYCKVARRTDGICGLEGNLFEQDTSFIFKIVNFFKGAK